MRWRYWRTRAFAQSKPGNTWARRKQIPVSFTKTDLQNEKWFRFQWFSKAAPLFAPILFVLTHCCKSKHSRTTPEMGTQCHPTAGQASCQIRLRKRVPLNSLISASIIIASEASLTKTKLQRPTLSSGADVGRGIPYNLWLQNILRSRR